MKILQVIRFQVKWLHYFNCSLNFSLDFWNSCEIVSNLSFFVFAHTLVRYSNCIVALVVRFRFRCSFLVYFKTENLKYENPIRFKDLLHKDNHLRTLFRKKITNDIRLVHILNTYEQQTRKLASHNCYKIKFE